MRAFWCVGRNVPFHDLIAEGMLRPVVMIDVAELNGLAIKLLVLVAIWAILQWLATYGLLAVNVMTFDEHRDCTCYLLDRYELCIRTPRIPSCL